MIGMRKLGMLAALAMAPAAAQAFTTDGQEDICADPHVIMCENFESRTVGPWSATMQTPIFKNGGWDSGSDDTTLSIVDTQAFDGSKSWQMFYSNGNGVATPEARSAGFASIPITPGMDYYVRSYVKHSANFVWSNTANKWIYFNTADSPDNTFLWESGNWGGSTPAGSTTYGGTTGLTENVTTVSFAANQWYCTEFHAKMNRPNQSDGTFEAWIDGKQVASYVGNVNFRPTGNPFNSFEISGFWNCYNVPCTNTDPLDQHPDMYRWQDNIVISTQRIGCLGSPPPPADTTPPAAPGGVKIL